MVTMAFPTPDITAMDWLVLLVTPLALPTPRGALKASVASALLKRLLPLLTASIPAVARALLAKLSGASLPRPRGLLSLGVFIAPMAFIPMDVVLPVTPVAAFLLPTGAPKVLASKT